MKTDKQIINNLLHGDPSVDEILQAQEIIAERGDTQEISDMLEAAFLSMELGSETKESCRALDRIRTRLGFRPLRSPVRTGLRIIELAAAILAIPLGVLYSRSSSQPEPPEWHQFTGTHGEKTGITLSDGTSLTLNGEGYILYPEQFTGSERKVFAVGDVYADVTSDPDCPFIIESQGTMTRVLGTKFELKSHEKADCIELYLKEGSVEFSTQKEGVSSKVDMSAGDILQFDKHTKDIRMTSGATLTTDACGEEGQTVFYNRTLKDIAVDLENSFGARVMIMNKKWNDARFWAIFSNGEDLDQILSALNADGKMKITKKNDMILIY